jgi:hypothetical protein
MTGATARTTLATGGASCASCRSSSSRRCVRTHIACSTPQCMPSIHSAVRPPGAWPLYVATRHLHATAGMPVQISSLLYFVAVCPVLRFGPNRSRFPFSDADSEQQKLAGLFPDARLPLDRHFLDDTTFKAAMSFAGAPPPPPTRYSLALQPSNPATCSSCLALQCFPPAVVEFTTLLCPLTMSHDTVCCWVLPLYCVRRAVLRLDQWLPPSGCDP